MERKVFIVNYSAHDFTEAKKFGKLISLSSGSMNRYATNNMHRQFSEIMEDCQPGDYILMSGLSVMNVIATNIFVSKHGRLNLLMFRKGDYLERNLVFR